jgi:hypothetical protein
MQNQRIPRGPSPRMISGQLKTDHGETGPSAGGRY